MAEKGIKRYSLAKQVADSIEQMIEEGTYKIGDKIPTEVVLMEMFNVSRNTVREAIQSLNSSGIVEVKQGDGTYVKYKNRFNGYMSSKYEQVSERDIKDTRIALEIAIAHLSAERRTEKEMQKIEKTFMRRKELINNVKENTIADIEFHMAIAESCHNKLLLDLYQSISAFVINHITQRHSEEGLDMERIDSLHEKLYFAILNKNTEEARQCAGDILID